MQRATRLLLRGGPARRVVPAVAAAIILAGFGSSDVAAQEPAADGEVRITARRLADGRTEFALQERAAGGSWGERRLPRARFVPASPAVDRWLSSSVLTIDLPALAMLSAEEHASVEVRIAARRLADGRTEVALQERSPGGSWSVRRLPRSRFIPARPVVGRWLSSSSITAPSALPDGLPGVSEVEVVPRQNGIEIAFVGEQLGASSWWGPPTPEEYVPDAMADIVEFFEQHSGAAATPVVVVFRNTHTGGDTTPPGLIRIGLGTGTQPERFRWALAHEYYRVLQLEAAGGDLRWPGTPRWMYEGGAKRSEILLRGLSAGDRRDFLIRDAIGGGPLCGGGDAYTVGALAIDWLTERSGVDPLEFYRSIGPPPEYGTDAWVNGGTRWERAFDETYGLTTADLCTEFEEYRTEAESRLVASFSPHLVDDVIEPVVEVVGSPPAGTVRGLRAEIDALREFWLDRFGADADYTVRIREGDASQEIRSLPRRGHYGFGPCVSHAEPPGVIVLNASAECDWSDSRASLSVLRGFHLDMVIAHLTRDTPSARYELPLWLDWGVSSYTTHHYNLAHGGHTQERADALRSLRRVGSLRDAGLRGTDGDDLFAAGFLAVEWLVERSGERSIVDFYRALGDAAGWEAAFAAAFGLTVDAFYAEFER